AAELVAEALRRLVSLTPQEVSEELAGGTLVVDLREEEELHVVGWIRDSVWAPRGMLEFWADPLDRRHRVEFHPERRLILCCSTGERSALAAATLRTMGYRDVGVLDGGIEAWKQEGLPVEMP
ncbi:MAG TPA: rhodanese-like domain-containing protein, partial [Acidimicrobiia bacterium]